MVLLPSFFFLFFLVDGFGFTGSKDGNFRDRSGTRSIVHGEPPYHSEEPINCHDLRTLIHIYLHFVCVPFTLLDSVILDSSWFCAWGTIYNYFHCRKMSVIYVRPRNMMTCLVSCPPYIM